MRVPNPLWRLTKCLQMTHTEKIIQQSAKVINDFANKVIQQKRRTANSTKKDSSAEKDSSTKKEETKKGDPSSLGPDLISRFLDKSKKENSEAMSNKELRDIVLNFMIAGRDTTACALTWSIYELTQHPEHAKHIRNGEGYIKQTKKHGLVM